MIVDGEHRFRAGNFKDWTKTSSFPCFVIKSNTEPHVLRRIGNYVFFSVAA